MDTERITRRTAAGLLLAGAALSATKALAAPRGELTLTLDSEPTVVALTTFSGETITATFASELRIGSHGSARGSMRFAFGEEVVGYVAELGGLDFSEEGDPIRGWFLMRLRGSDGRQAQDFLLGSVHPEPTEPCRIYDILGTQFNHEPARFDVPGAWVVR